MHGLSPLVMKIKLPHFSFHMASIYVIFLISTLFTLSSAGDVNIDCGSTDLAYTDENLMVWEGDDSFMANGQSEVVQNSDSISHVLDTLRVFTTRKKNCYSADAVRGDRVLIRASFNYGNYDRKSSPPSFDLQFDGNHWVTVETSSTGNVYYEAIYVAKNDYVSACVARTNPGQFPFMSALEIHFLDAGMYGHVDKGYPLFLVSRVAYGAKETVRYSGYDGDAYDRIWTPAAVGNGLTTLATDAYLVEADVADNPPAAVLQNAVTAATPTGEIRLLTGLSSSSVSVYLNMYFSEVTQLDTTQTRSFQILVNNKPLLDQPILPIYANCTEVYLANLTASSSTSFVLSPTKDSTLPPLINAMEVYTIGGLMTDGTDSRDVKGLDSLQSTFAVLQDWTGDPCLPSPYSWDWINCTTDSPPRVSALYLSSFGLSGEIPDFSSMDALVAIDLHNNSLTGGIPDFLATVPKLKQLNLGSNQLTGPIPGALSKKNGLNLVVSGNPGLCKPGESSCSTTTGSPSDIYSDSNPNSRKTKSNKGVILGTTIPTSVVVSLALFFFGWYRRRKHNAVASAGHGGNNGGSRPHATSSLGKIGEEIMNEIRANVEDEIANNVEGQVGNYGQQQNNGAGGT